MRIRIRRPINTEITTFAYNLWASITRFSYWGKTLWRNHTTAAKYIWLMKAPVPGKELVTSRPVLLSWVICITFSPTYGPIAAPTRRVISPMGIHVQPNSQNLVKYSNIVQYTVRGVYNWQPNVLKLYLDTLIWPTLTIPIIPTHTLWAGQSENHKSATTCRLCFVLFR